ncbi:MaoC/PaaZ C-terminal domain-containing protein [Fusobacterium varium]|uniref:MaoC/PaaZ C-terminal domain-containing protein n=1 Tax=Fusobacterium varium TaxID=856 RepID=UPI0032C127A3
MKASFKIKITEEMMKNFEIMTGDINPLHINQEYAKEKGMLDKVVYGMLTSSFYSTLVGVYLPGKRCLLQGIEISFKKPVYIGEEIEIYGEISYLNEAYKIAEIKAYIKNESKKTSTAKITVGVI